MAPTILILSPEHDPAAVAVSGLLRDAGARVLHLHDRDPIVEVSTWLSDDGEDFSLRTLGGLRVSLGQVDACWFHRGALVYGRTQPVPAEQEAYRSAEWDSVRACVRAMLADRPSLGALHRISTADRLLQLRAARRAGLRIPDTAVANHREGADRALARTGAAVTKALAHGVPGHTRAVSSGAVDTALPMLLQARQPRQADLRIFYLDGACWGIAVFPHDPDVVDWRIEGYDGGRAVPFRPPPSLHRAIRRLMDALRLDTGSLDFILRPDDHAVFLEVNPAGQFSGMPCGADLHREVAAALLARASGKLPSPAPLPEADPAPLGAPLVRLHAGCVREQALLVDQEFHRSVPVPERFLRAVEAGATRAQLRAAFGDAGLVLTDALLQAGMALETCLPQCFPRDGASGGRG